MVAFTRANIFVNYDNFFPMGRCIHLLVAAACAEPTGGNICNPS
jgi:hypothetical protein